MKANQALAIAIANAKSVAPGAITSAVEDWLDEHVDPDTGYVIDDTLAVTGAAADAKKVGDEISDLKSATDALDDRVTVLEAGALGDMTIEAFNRAVVMGVGAKAAPVGTALTVEKETGITVTTGTSGSGTPGVTGATVVETTFIEKIGHSDPGAYEFVYDGAAWSLDGHAVEMAQYGITPTGTPEVGDELVIHVAATEIAMNVLDHDYHTPVNSALTHSCTVGMRDCYENRQFDAPEALIKVVDGLAAGSHFYITLYKGAYGGGTGQDGVYGGQLGAEQAIPAGGYLRHTTIGLYQSGGYSADQITAGKWIAYDTSFTQIGAQIATDTSETGTDFGTATASTYQGNSEHVNFTERNQYGNNRIDQSAWLQIANTDGLLQWVQKNEWDFPPANHATIKGLLTGLDPTMKAAMIPVTIRTAKPTCDGGGYIDIQTKVFPLSQTEVNLGQNNSQYETSFGMNNTLKTVPLAFYDGATNADRIKTLNGAARHWFLRGATPSNAYYVRIVNTDGSLSRDGASNAYGLVAAWVIGNPNIATA